MDQERKRRVEAGEAEESLLEKIAGMAGMRKMSDEEYIDILEERALELDTDIAMVDEQIEDLKEKQRELEKAPEVVEERRS